MIAICSNNLVPRAFSLALGKGPGDEVVAVTLKKSANEKFLICRRIILLKLSRLSHILVPFQEAADRDYRTLCPARKQYILAGWSYE